VAVGTRSTDPALDRALREVLAASLVTDSGDPANLSLVGPGSDPDGGASRKHYGLWRGRNEVVRARTADRLIRAAAAWVEGFSPTRPDGLLGLGCLTLLDRESRAWLAPSPLTNWLLPIEARLRPAGFRPVDGPVTHVDAGTAEVVVGARVAPGRLAPAPGDAVPDGRYPLAGFLVRVPVEGGRLTAAHTVSAYAPWMTNLAQYGPGPALEALARLVGDRRFAGYQMAAPRDVIAQIVRGTA
jgi:hypothetical protein